MANNSVIPQPPIVQTQQSLNCQPGVILPPAPYQPGQQIIQQLPTGQMIQRQLSVGGTPGVQAVLSQPNLIPVSSSSGIMNTLPAGTQMFCQ